MKLDLNEGWKLYKAPMSCGSAEAMRIDKAYDCALPADVRMPLIENGVIRDPVLGGYCFESEGIERYAGG